MSDILVYGSSGGRLPSGYQEVEYISATSSNGAYIDIGIGYNSGEYSELGWINQAIGETYPDIQIFGCTDSTASNRWLLSDRYGSASSSEQTRTFYDSVGSGYRNNYYPFRSGIAVGDEQQMRFQVDMSTGVFTATDLIGGGAVSSATATLTAYSISNHMFLLGQNYKGSYRGNGLKQITFFRHYNSDGTLIRNMIPCYRKSDIVAGMYDLINSVFYINAGSGSFTVGPDVGSEGYLIKTVTKSSLYLGSMLLDNTVNFISDGSKYQIDSVKTGNGVYAPTINPTKTNYKFLGWGETDSASTYITFPYIPTTTTKNIYANFTSWIPDAYQAVEYITLNANSIINTNFVIDNENTKVEFKAKCYNYSTNSWGSSTNADTNWFNPYFTQYGWDFYIGSSQAVFRSAMPSRDTVYAGSLETNNGTATLIVTEGSTYNSSISYSGTIINGDNNPIALGGVILNGTASRMTGGHTIYYYKIYSNGILVRYLIPCYLKATPSSIGLYDIANRVFYTNYGTGTITAGPDVN